VAVSRIKGSPLSTISLDIDFSASDSEDVVIPITHKMSHIFRGRLYIDTDPGAAFSAWAKYTFYNKAAMRGEDAFYRTEAKLVYTELEDPTVIGSPDITPDDHTDFSPNDLALILGASEEYVRLKTIADTMVAEDNLLAVHPVDTGLVRISEFSGFSLFNNEGDSDVYLNISFAVAQTVSLKMELLVRGFYG